MYNVLYKIFLYTHVISGITALLTGLLSIAAAKGGKIHRTSGKIFFAAMISVSLTAFIISIVKENSFLFAIGIFSFYMNYTGYRALKNKEVKYKWFDWLVVAFALITAAYMIWSRNTVLMVFGIIQSYLLFINTRAQFQNEEKQKEARKRRVITHLGNMMGTYIATVTAFVVVNVNNVKPPWLFWLLPTILGVPVILYYSSVWKKN